MTSHKIYSKTLFVVCRTVLSLFNSHGWLCFVDLLVNSFSWYLFILPSWLYCFSVQYTQLFHDQLERTHTYKACKTKPKKCHFTIALQCNLLGFMSSSSHKLRVWLQSWARFVYVFRFQTIFSFVSFNFVVVSVPSAVINGYNFCVFLFESSLCVTPKVVCSCRAVEHIHPLIHSSECSKWNS